MNDSQPDITRLLRSVASGDRRELDTLMDAVYQDLRRLAAHHMKSERDDHTLQPTALVSEVYLKLIDQRSTDWNDRVHFFALASGLIRRILVDHARGKNAEKRGGGKPRFSLSEHEPALAERELDLVALDEAMNELHELNEKQAQIVELRYFGGLTLDEIAETLSIGRRSVDRDWSAAKAWLYCQISNTEQTDGD